jgi:hypothetical protein
MVGALANAVIVASLLMAAWALVIAARNRLVTYIHLAALALVEVLVLAQVVVAVGRLVGGERPTSVVTFVGYLIAAALILPAAGTLAVVERTRWGTVIVGVAALLLPVLVVRLQQVWHG